MKRAILEAGALMAFLAVTVAGCGDDEGPFQPNPTPNPAFVPDSVQSIFDASCARSGCHSGDLPAAGMSLVPASAYDALVDHPSVSCAPQMRVRPFKPDSSCLVHRVEGTITPQMPIASTPLTAEQIATIRGWIAAGAPFDTSQVVRVAHR